MKSNQGFPGAFNATCGRYDEQRSKRQKTSGMQQYIDVRTSRGLNRLLEDPWIETTLPSIEESHCGKDFKVLIVGAGFAGVLSAIHLIKSGIAVDSILLVDVAGGFGGTWWWNRYPGAACDVESYIYLPLLEDTGYIPKQKYSAGWEIREYVSLLAQSYKLHYQAWFGTSVEEIHWNDCSKRWSSRLFRKGQCEPSFIQSDFVILASGVLHNAKLPAICESDIYRGHMFHTARWDYGFTGGAQDNPEMTKLKDKDIAIVGTGATAIQAIPHLAKHARRLYVFQRTPSAVDFRMNQDTYHSEWKVKVASEPGWQEKRARNFEDHLTNTRPRPAKDLIDDHLTKMASFSGLAGTPNHVEVDRIHDHVRDLYEMDLSRQERIRQRILRTVQDDEIANDLQPWYPGWCKRPCFSDEYLQTFNRSNVQLVDVSSHAIDLDRTGVRVNDETYRVDAIIWATGYMPPSMGSPAGKAGIRTIGRGGISLEDSFNRPDMKTLHGIMSPGFPNMFFPWSAQGGFSVNRSHHLTHVTQHIAHLISTVINRHAVAVEPLEAAAEDWARQIAAGAFKFAAMRKCMPSYYNKETDLEALDEQARSDAARKAQWSHGSVAFAQLLRQWREAGDLAGLEVTYNHE